MTTFTCPDCEANREVADAANTVLCPSCGESWVFRVCRCGAVVTVNAAWRRFTCLTRGHEQSSSAGGWAKGMADIGCGLTILVWVVLPLVFIALALLL